MIHAFGRDFAIAEDGLVVRQCRVRPCVFGTGETHGFT